MKIEYPQVKFVMDSSLTGTIIAGRKRDSPLQLHLFVPLRFLWVTMLFVIIQRHFAYLRQGTFFSAILFINFSPKMQLMFWALDISFQQQCVFPCEVLLYWISGFFPIFLWNQVYRIISAVHGTFYSIIHTTLILAACPEVSHCGLDNDH